MVGDSGGVTGFLCLGISEQQYSTMRLHAPKRHCYTLAVLIIGSKWLFFPRCGLPDWHCSHFDYCCSLNLKLRICVCKAPSKPVKSLSAIKKSTGNQKAREAPEIQIFLCSQDTAGPSLHVLIKFLSCTSNQGKTTTFRVQTCSRNSICMMMKYT